jgi:hypothetical protein
VAASVESEQPQVAHAEAVLAPSERSAAAKLVFGRSWRVIRIV